ncbi:hypothetical protein AB1K91_05155 [Terribacillus sp. 179-K 1B1 HS]|uniref:hypothetical protein n=1 Tax=Terribacillus sp. 179-K 1B1 HS TaxID=3142388 RepID=UPI0039A3B253
MCNQCNGKGVIRNQWGCITEFHGCPNGCRRATPEELSARIERQMQRLLAVMREEQAV